MGNARTSTIDGRSGESRAEGGTSAAPPERNVISQPPLRVAIQTAHRRPEQDCMPELLDAAWSSPSSSQAAHELAKRLVAALRAKSSVPGKRALLPSLLQTYPLSSPESTALMCLAEALLRILDAATRDALIRDKLALGDWRAAAGQSRSVFAGAAGWSLLIAGKLSRWNGDASAPHAIARLISEGFAPLARTAAAMAMRAISGQFVAGERIEDALVHARRYESMGFRYSYDMLGEAAISATDAERYFAAYEFAIHAIGKAAHGRGPQDAPGISVKLSALHPRYGRAQRERVMREMLPRLRSLTVLARRHSIGLDIDAEEANRLELSLDLV